jgi:hypothetical protein
MGILGVPLFNSTVCQGMHKQIRVSKEQMQGMYILHNMYHTHDEEKGAEQEYGVHDI